jgi:hypothetical protein
MKTWVAVLLLPNTFLTQTLGGSIPDTPETIAAGKRTVGSWVASRPSLGVIETKTSTHLGGGDHFLTACASRQLPSHYTDWDIYAARPFDSRSKDWIYTFLWFPQAAYEHSNEVTWNSFLNFITSCRGTSVRRQQCWEKSYSAFVDLNKCAVANEVPNFVNNKSKVQWIIYSCYVWVTARLLRSWVRITPAAWMFVVSVVCCQVEVSAMDWSLIQKSPTDCGASLCVIKNLVREEAKAPLEGCKIQTHNGMLRH